MKRRTIIFTVLLLVLLAAAAPVGAQVSDSAAPDDAPAARPPWYAGISAGMFYSMHAGGFAWPHACAECGVYDGGSGIGTALDLRVSIPVTRRLRVEPRLYGECHRARFTSDPIHVDIIGHDMQPQDVVLEDELTYTLRLIGIEAMAAVAVGPRGFSLLAGPAIGFRVTESATVTERIVSPDGVLFLDGSREHTVADGDADKARALHAGIRAGAAYMLPLGRDLQLGLEATWLLPLRTVADGAEWRTSGVRVLASLLFAM